MTRKKQWTNETNHSRHAYKYTSMSQVPASTIMTIRKELAGGWVEKSYHTGAVNTSQISKHYPEISPHCLQEIIRMYSSEIVISDNSMNIHSVDATKVLRR